MQKYPFSQFSCPLLLLIYFFSPGECVLRPGIFPLLDSSLPLSSCICLCHLPCLCSLLCLCPLLFNCSLLFLSPIFSFTRQPAEVPLQLQPFLCAVVLFFMSWRAIYQGVLSLVNSFTLRLFQCGFVKNPFPRKHRKMFNFGERRKFEFWWN